MRRVATSAIKSGYASQNPLKVGYRYGEGMYDGIVALAPLGGILPTSAHTQTCGLAGYGVVLGGGECVGGGAVADNADQSPPPNATKLGRRARARVSLSRTPRAAERGAPRELVSARRNHAGRRIRSAIAIRRISRMVLSNTSHVISFGDILEIERPTKRTDIGPPTTTLYIKIVYTCRTSRVDVWDFSSGRSDDESARRASEKSLSQPPPARSTVSQYLVWAPRRGGGYSSLLPWATVSGVYILWRGVWPASLFLSMGSADPRTA